VPAAWSARELRIAILGYNSVMSGRNTTHIRGIAVRVLVHALERLLEGHLSSRPAFSGEVLMPMLVLSGIEFPCTHQIGSLRAWAPVQVRPTLTPQEQERLT
jgi:hypothetical protein